MIEISCNFVYFFREFFSTSQAGAPEVVTIRKTFPSFSLQRVASLFRGELGRKRRISSTTNKFLNPQFNPLRRSVGGFWGGGSARKRVSVCLCGMFGGNQWLLNQTMGYRVPLVLTNIPLNSHGTPWTTLFGWHCRRGQEGRGLCVRAYVFVCSSWYPSLLSSV